MIRSPIVTRETMTRAVREKAVSYAGYFLDRVARQHGKRGCWSEADAEDVAHEALLESLDKHSAPVPVARLIRKHAGRVARRLSTRGVNKNRNPFDGDKLGRQRHIEFLIFVPVGKPGNPGKAVTWAPWLWAPVEGRATLTDPAVAERIRRETGVRVCYQVVREHRLRAGLLAVDPGITSDRQDLAVVRRLALGETNAQVAASLGCRPSTIRERLSRAYKRHGIIVSPGRKTRGRLREQAATLLAKMEEGLPDED